MSVPNEKLCDYPAEENKSPETPSIYCLKDKCEWYVVDNQGHETPLCPHPGACNANTCLHPKP